MGTSNIRFYTVAAFVCLLASIYLHFLIYDINSDRFDRQYSDEEFQTSEITEQSPPPTNLSLVRVRTSDLSISEQTSRIKASGFVEAKRVSRLTTRLEGIVSNVSQNVGIGNWLDKGEVIMTIESTPYLAALLSARQQLAEAKVQHLEEMARADLAKSQISKERYDSLPFIATRKPHLEQAINNVEAKRVELRLAEKDLLDTEISAPFAGQILTTEVAVAEWINQGDELLTIADTKDLKITVPLTPAQWILMPEVIVGQPVAINSGPVAEQQTIPGTIVAVSPHIDATTNNRFIVVGFTVENTMTSSDVTIGEYAEVGFDGKSINNASWVPTAAITPFDYIWGIEASNKVRKLSVNIHQYNGDNALISYNSPTESIKSIVINPSNNLAPGQTVLPLENETISRKMGSE